MSTYRGLSTIEAKNKLLAEGYNEIITSKFSSKLEELKKILLDPGGLMLLVLAVLHAIIGDLKDSYILMAAYFPITAVDVLLEIRTQRALKAMRSKLASRAKLIRDGEICEIPIREIVCDDLLVFEEGQSLPADGVILNSANLSLNESALSGESIPIDKNEGDRFYAGTTIYQGRGLGLIQSTGKNTEFGKIASLLEKTKGELSPSQKKVQAALKKILLLAGFLVVVLFVIELSRGRGIVPSLIIAMTFGMSTVPEEFPLVFTLYLSLGAWRLSKHGVLIRSLPCIETLGNVDVICTDKTGTLTEGVFQLEQLLPINKDHEVDKLWQIALMACEEQAVDSMEIAIKAKGQKYQEQLKSWRLTHDYAFEQQGKYMTHVWNHCDGPNSLICMKGAIEGVLEHCLATELEVSRIISEVSRFANQGYRILGLAFREGVSRGVRSEDECGLTLVGLLLFTDPVRESAKKSIEACQHAGIEVKMLTGDHPLTAHAIADRTGIFHHHDFLFTGAQLESMSAEDRSLAYTKGAIFSRVHPEQKFEMVQALKKMGKVVAMTGDGINDAPALKLANIGISMGLNATDVARSTAQMILVKNDFKGLVEAVFEGRRIFANLQKSFSYLIAFHTPVVMLSLIPPLLGWGELLLPIHIVVLELLVHPISAFAFENLPLQKESTRKALLTKKMIISSSVAGILLSLCCLLIFRFFSVNGAILTARAYSVLAIFLGNMLFVWKEFNFKVNKRLLITEFILALFTAFLFLIEPIADMLHLNRF